MSNIQVSHSVSTDNARSESNVVVNPFNPNQIVGGSKKFSNPHTYQFTIATYYSTDGGYHWNDSAALPLLAGWAGVSDPALAWDNQNNCYLAALPFDAAFAIKGIAIYKSTDGGATWGNPVLVHASGGDDKQWAIGDPSSGNVYAAWDDGSTLRFARTTNHGANWKGTTGSPAAGAALANDSFAPEMAINASGHLYIFWSVRMAGTIKFVKSIDGGGSFSAPQIAVSGMTDLETVLPQTDGWAHLPGGMFRVLTIVTCSVGRNNEIMVAWADGREVDSSANHVSRVYYRRSVDGGASWLGSPSGDPLLGGASIAETMHHFHPQIINRPNTDQVGCTFYEFGPKTGGQLLIDTMMSYSLNNGGLFGAPTLVTDQPWNPLTDAPWSHGDANVHFIGDYFGLDASNIGFYPFWTDTRTGIQEIFTAIVHPLTKSLAKDIKDAKEHKEIIPEKHWYKERLPEKIHFKEKDKEKDIYEDFGQKMMTEVIDPLQRGIDERFHALEAKIRDIEKHVRKGDVFISKKERPDVGSEVVKRSNRKARGKRKP